MLATLCAINLACMHGTDAVIGALSVDGALQLILYTHTPLPCAVPASHHYSVGSR
jgi:predicted ATPase